MICITRTDVAFLTVFKLTHQLLLVVNYSLKKNTHIGNTKGYFNN